MGDQFIRMRAKSLCGEETRKRSNGTMIGRKPRNSERIRRVYEAKAPNV